ncbi:MAG TPA: MCP four helix bundle domain-containing protein, partial [Magnetospirillaceae bacterium]|nr:MCP four helix bundle domain-containing protein [Magnetospirillaceae bacterium]
MLKNLKVGTRLALGFALMIVLLVAIAALSILRIQELNEAVNLLVLDRYQKVAQVNEAINQVNVIAQSLRDMILWGENIQEVNNESDRIVTAQTSITKIIEELTRNITDEESKKRLAHLNVTRQAYLTGQNAIMELANVGQAETYQQATDLLLGPYQTQQGDYVSAWGALREYQYELASEDAAKAKATAERAIRIVILISAASIVLALLFALLITRSIVNPLGICIAAAGKLAKGETQMDFDTSGKDELATLQREMKTMTDTIRSMVSDAVMLSQAAVEGRLKIRADASRHQGDFKNIVQGVNETLDAVIGPLKVAASYVDRISKGDIPEKITDEYKGDFNLIKNNLNTCVDAIKALVADTDILTQAAIEGKLATRADTA